LRGGLATRLRPATEKIPKSLLEVNGEPFIAHQLRLLKASGVSQVVLCVGFLGEMVRDVVKNGHSFGLDVHYSFDGPALLGTAGALKRALPALGKAVFDAVRGIRICCATMRVWHGSLKPRESRR